MNSVLKFSLVLILFLLFGLSSSSLTNAGSINNQAGSDLQEYYKQMYEDQKDYNDRILNTIYWALGGLGTAIISIVGLNVFNSNRSNKASVEAIKQEILKINEEESKQNNIRLVERFDQLREQSSSELNELLKQREQILNDRFKNIQSEYIHTTKSIKQTLKLEREATKELEDSLSKVLKRIEGSGYKNTADIYEIKGVYGNQLRFLAMAIEIKVELNAAPELLLEKLLTSLQKLEHIHTLVHHDVSKVIKKLPEEYSGIQARINEQLSTIKIV
ncbi:hypothetical protein [Paenibacillus illinoisensis]|uniref:hypothetical protein n=1 Tax=Paenibacillus illinoisensis TaxID=59845 RepID=UPI000FD70D66|nr:hypothetical protein [Paenibacillus illinoisensis]